MSAEDGNDRANGGDSGPLDGSLASAADRIREAAKWLIVSFAAVGVTLFGGLQLASIGKLTWDHPERLSAAVLGVLLGLIGIGIAIAGASSVVTKSYVSLRWLETLDAADPVRADIEGDTVLLGGYESIAELSAALEEAQLRRLQAYQHRYAPAPANEDEERRKQRIARANAEFQYADNWALSLEQVQTNVLEVASFNRVRSAYEGARIKMFLGAALTATGIAAFAWGANPPERIAAVEVLPSTPSNVTVTIDKEDRDAKRPDLNGTSLQQTLGMKCDLSSLNAVAVGARGESYEVVSARTDKCRAALFSVAPTQGKVLPRSSD